MIDNNLFLLVSLVKMFWNKLYIHNTYKYIIYYLYLLYLL